MNALTAGAESMERGAATVGADSREIRYQGRIAQGVAVGLAYLLALSQGQEQILLVIVAIAAGLAIVSPGAGLATLVLVMPMHETELLEPIRVNAILAGAVLLGCVLRLPVDRPRLKVLPVVVLLLGYVAVSALSIPPILSGHPIEWTPSALNELVRLSTGVALFLSALYVFKTAPYGPYLAVAIASVTGVAILAIGELLGFGPITSWLSGLLSDGPGSLRATGAFSDPNFLGLLMTTAAVLVVGLIPTAPRPMKLLLLVVAAVLVGCVFLSFSRGALVGLAVGITVLIAVRSRIGAVLFASLAVIGALTLYPAFLEARVGQTPSLNEGFNLLLSESARTAVATAGIAMFVSAPLFGVGFGVFHFVSPFYTGASALTATYSHNQYLNVFAEQGLVGSLLFIGVIVAFAMGLARSDSPLRWAAIAMGAAYLTMSLFIHSTTSFQSSCLLWLVLAAALTPRRVGSVIPKES